MCGNNLRFEKLKFCPALCTLPSAPRSPPPHFPLQGTMNDEMSPHPQPKGFVEMIAAEEEKEEENKDHKHKGHGERERERESKTVQTNPSHTQPLRPCVVPSRNRTNVAYLLIGQVYIVWEWNTYTRRWHLIITFLTILLILTPTDSAAKGLAHINASCTHCRSRDIVRMKIYSCTQLFSLTLVRAWHCFSSS